MCSSGTPVLKLQRCKRVGRVSVYAAKKNAPDNLEGTRPNISNFRSLKIHERTTFYLVQNNNRRVSLLRKCEMFGSVDKMEKNEEKLSFFYLPVFCCVTLVPLVVNAPIFF